MSLASDGLGRRLYDARIARDVTMDQLADLSDISQSTISRLERGLRVADAVMIERLSLALTVDPCWLAFGTEGVVFKLRSRVRLRERARA